MALAKHSLPLITWILLSLLGSAALSPYAFSEEKPKLGSILVTVSELKPVQGKLRVGLYNSEESWKEKTKDPNKQTSFRTQIVEVTKSTQTIEFKDLPYGDYVAAISHDVNGDGKFERPEKSKFGLNKWEPYGISNCTKKLKRMSWKDAKRPHAGDKTPITITVLHR
jgi:uncharacterized protein (DUF2141 family)